MGLDNWSWIVGSWSRGWSSVGRRAVDNVEGTTLFGTITEIGTPALHETSHIIASAKV